MAEVEIDIEALEAEVVRRVGEDLTGPNGLAWQAIEESHAKLQEYADDYNVEPIIDSLVVPREGMAFDPQAGEIDLQWEWRHPATQYFEYGTSRHDIHGQPWLSFIWEDAPEEIHEMFPHTERQDGDPRVFFRNVTVSGISRTRFIQHGREWLLRELSARYG